MEKAEILNDRQVKMILKPRDPYGNKYTNGKVLVIAGSEAFPGAAMLSVESALRSGAGLVNSATPSSISDMVSIRCPESLRTKLGRDDKYLNISHLNSLVEASGKADSIVIGPGIGRNPETINLVKAFLQSTLCKKVVLDADALFAICGEYSILSKLDTIITPHEMEASRLLNCDPIIINKERLISAKKLHNQYGAVVLLKGKDTIILRDEETYSLNKTGNTSLSKGGSGDVLAGLIGGIFATGISSYDAARCGAYIHGRAADLLSSETSEYSVIPSDLGVAFKSLLC